MNILLFGGNSQRNRQWIHQVADELTLQFDKCIVHDYLHWNGNGEFIDFDTELARLTDLVTKLDDYIIFAKSVGSVLTLKGITFGILKPAKCIFAGLPLKLAEEDNIPLRELLRNSHIPTLILQNTSDPTGSYKKIQEYIKGVGVSNYITHEFNGDTHSYDNLDEIKRLIQSFVG